jgi:hypothetical protein
MAGWRRHYCCSACIPRLTRLLTRETEMQFAYEDLTADLRGQVDRLAGRQLLDQEQVEGKLEQIARRQALLESRSSALTGLPDPSPTGSIRPAPRGAAPAILVPTAAPKPSPINDTVILVPPPEREARLESRTPLNSGVRLAARQPLAGIEGALARLQISLDRFEAGQVKTLNAMEESFDAKARRMRNILAISARPRQDRACADTRVSGGRSSGEPRISRSTVSSIASGSRAARLNG